MFDPVAIAAAHVAAITALEAAGDSVHAETLRVHGVECLRLARAAQATHQACLDCTHRPHLSDLETNRYHNGG
jgi:hypothetical protein